jgi:hypothetical protein
MDKTRVESAAGGGRGLRADGGGAGRSVTVYERRRAKPSRPPRADKGVLRLTERDLAVLTWIGEQYAVRFDTLRQLLDRRPAGEGGRIAPRNARRVLARWQALQLVVYRKLLYHEPGWVWLSYRGLREMGLPYRIYTPAAVHLRHFHVVNELRLKLEARYGSRLAWKSERRLRQEAERRPEGERRRVHVTDGELALDGAAIGVEVELTQKAAGRLAEILGRLRGQYAGVWYFVNDATEAPARRAVGEDGGPFKVYNLKEVLG